MQRLKIGELKDGMAVRISQKSPNEHLLLVGTSGSGKSTRIKEIIQDSIRQGETLIAIDLNGCDFTESIQNVNLISAKEDGLNFSFLDMKFVENGKEMQTNFISGVVEAFSAIANLGVRQMGALRTAVIYAIEKKDEYKEEMQAISEGLKRQNDSVASGVHNKLWNILEGNVFRESKKHMQKGCINVLSFEGVNPFTQKQCIELILRLLWKQCRLGEKNMQKIRIVIDEFQNLSLRQNSVLMEMLRESRKYDVHLILATQSISNFSKEVMAAINQTAVQLYFRQSVSDMKKVAECIEPTNGGRWTLILKSLDIGESVATGDFSIGGREIAQPVIIKSTYRRENMPINVNKRIE